MKILHGKYNSAKVFTDNIEETASSQIVKLLDQDFVSGAKVRIMPDTHAGAGCVIGFTADLGKKVIPNLVGVDIGCGMQVVKLGNIGVDLNELDSFIHKSIPSGHNIYESSLVRFGQIESLFCFDYLKNINKFNRAIGTLGGGNHFIELDMDDYGDVYLVIHSGSRNLGKQVADFYQDVAVDFCKESSFSLKDLRDKAIESLKKEGKQHLISSKLKEIEEYYSELQPKYPKELCFLEGLNRDQYLHDMEVCQEYASLNRKTMANVILEELLGSNLEDHEEFETIHNYISFHDGIIRKGAVSAYEGEELIIPINMRDGSIIAKGKGNSDWNFSAPHGAGRLMGRMEAKRSLSMSEFSSSMEGVFSTTVNESTLDEAPMAYKPMQEIIDNIQDTVEIIDVIKPIYNFKSVE